MIKFLVNCLLLLGVVADFDFGNNLCKSGHFVSAELKVKNSVGAPNYCIIDVRSRRDLLQNARVPRNEVAYRMM